MTAVITVANLKGGSGKTTCAVCLAHALAAAGRRPVLVDADPTALAVDWHRTGGWPLPVAALPSPTLHRQLAGVVDRRRFDLIIIDTPPLQDRAGIVTSALRAATLVVVPLAPTMIELRRVVPVWDAMREAGVTAPAVVLLNRTVPNATSTWVVRQALTDGGRVVLDVQIPRQERYAQAFGRPVNPAGPFTDVANELIKRGLV